ncbi:MAG TPA: hypothetical protein PKC18_01285 [Lacipirellulaceae bacterium]|nr:hypothetical protein [Lacipirellulaceae bacterium]HMP05732.1 hypothetical protein [Lacipirellulaceae bacterium]
MFAPLRHSIRLLATAAAIAACRGAAQPMPPIPQQAVLPMDETEGIAGRRIPQGNDLPKSGADEQRQTDRDGVMADQANTLAKLSETLNATQVRSTNSPAKASSNALGLAPMALTPTEFAASTTPVSTDANGTRALPHR